jgi:hypothetical protein
MAVSPLAYGKRLLNRSAIKEKGLKTISKLVC